MKEENFKNGNYRQFDGNYDSIEEFEKETQFSMPENQNIIDLPVPTRNPLNENQPKENQIQKFQFHENEINAVSIDGNPYFVAKNICDVLGIVNNRQALQGLENDEKLMYVLHTSGQNREVLLISEPGLYRLVMRSNKPEAKTFQKWVTSEVLPTIRKTGQYGKPLSIEEQTLNVLTHFQTRVKALETKNVELNQKIEIDKPKVEFHDTVHNSNGLISISTFAKILKVGRNNFFKFLKEKNVIMKNSTIPYQKYVDSQLLVVLYDTEKENPLIPVTYATGKGQIFLQRLWMDYQLDQEKNHRII